MYNCILKYRPVSETRLLQQQWLKKKKKALWYILYSESVDVTGLELLLHTGQAHAESNRQDRQSQSLTTGVAKHFCSFSSPIKHPDWQLQPFYVSVQASAKAEGGILCASLCLSNCSDSVLRRASREFLCSVPNVHTFIVLGLVASLQHYFYIIQWSVSISFIVKTNVILPWRTYTLRPATHCAIFGHPTRKIVIVKGRWPYLWSWLQNGDPTARCETGSRMNVVSDQRWPVSEICGDHLNVSIRSAVWNDVLISTPRVLNPNKQKGLQLAGEA